MMRQGPSSPYFLKALGRKQLPVQIYLPNGDYCLERVFKHDFFAATGLYRGANGRRVVVKFGRRADILGLPVDWIGRYLTRREGRIYQELADVSSVPPFCGFCDSLAFAHEYVEGHSLQKGEAISPEFFDQLENLIAEIHRRGMAYVDLEKRENIIVGDDGRPHLIDFQIAWFMPGWWGEHFPPFRWIRQTLQQMDCYHLQKHRSRYFPDQFPPESIEPPWTIRLHRAIARPLQVIRRGFLRNVDPDYPTAPKE